MHTDPFAKNFIEPVTLEPLPDDPNAAPRRFFVTERDMMAMLSLAKHRYLMTHQIKSLVFPACINSQRAQQRLKLLLQAGYVERKPTFTSNGGRGDYVWHLTGKGAEFLQRNGHEIPIPGRKNGHASSGHLLHTVAVADFRIRLEREIEQWPSISIERYLTDSDIRSHERRTKKGRDDTDGKPILLHSVQDPDTKRKLTLYPDSLIVLCTPVPNSSQPAFHRLLLLVEIDRGTEPMHVIENKVKAYGLGMQQRVFQSFQPNGKLILFVTTGEKRTLNIREAAQGADIEKSVWVTDVGRMAGGILSNPIWLDGQKRRAILKTPQTPAT